MNNPVPRVEQFLERGKQHGVVAAVAGEFALLQMPARPDGRERGAGRGGLNHQSERADHGKRLESAPRTRQLGFIS